MRAAVVAQHGRDRRRGCNEREVAFVFAVENAQRVALEPPLRLGARAAPTCGRKCASSASRIARAAGVVADRVDVQDRVVDPVAANEFPRQRDDFEVRFGAGVTEALDAELVRLGDSGRFCGRS